MYQYTSSYKNHKKRKLHFKTVRASTLEEALKLLPKEITIKSTTYYQYGVV